MIQADLKAVITQWDNKQEVDIKALHRITRQLDIKRNLEATSFELEKLFQIVTDGYPNASREQKAKNVNSLLNLADCFISQGAELPKPLKNKLNQLVEEILC